MEGMWIAQGSQGAEELSFLFCGRRSCDPGEEVGPAVREHYVMHYCLSGRGVFRVQDASYEIGPGEGFLIRPGELVSHQADSAEPWTHIWVGFAGAKAADCLKDCGLNRESHTYRCAHGRELEVCVENMTSFDTAGAGNKLMLLGQLYTFLGWVAQSAQTQTRRGREAGLEYVKLAEEYIRSHYQEDLTVTKLARYVGLNRSYLTTVFQNTVHESPQQYLMRFRMERAARMLQAGELAVAEIARSCGYPDPLTFSKAFKRTMGDTPSQYRQKHRGE